MYHVSWSTQEGPGQEAAHVLHVSACDSCSSQTGTTKKEGGWGRLLLHMQTAKKYKTNDAKHAETRGSTR